MAGTTRAEHFAHGADIGVRGIGPSLEAAFEQAAVALAASITPVELIGESSTIEIACEAPTIDLLLFDWLNQLIYEMALRRMIFHRFAVTIDHVRLRGRAWGEPIDPSRHAPAVEPKGATLTALKVEQDGNGGWVAQCVVDV